MDAQKTILIVNGLTAPQNKTKKIFEPQYNIIEANNTKTALTILNEKCNSISIILLHLGITIYDDLELLRAINKNESICDIPTVVISPKPNIEKETAALNLGAINVITQPIEPALLALQVKNIIDHNHYINQQSLKEEKMLPERYNAMLTQTNTMVLEYNIEDGTVFYSENIKEQLAGDYNNTVPFIKDWENNETLKRKDIVLLDKYIREVLANPEKSIPSIALPLKTINQEYQWHKFSTSLITDKDENNHRIIISMNNIQNEKEAERSISEKADIINMISDTVGVGLVVFNIDKGFSVYYIHHNFCDLLGYTKNEIMELCGGIGSGLIYPPDKDSALKQMAKAQANGDEYTATYRIKKKDGTLAWFQENGKRVMSHDGVSRINSIFTDISVLKSTIDTLHYQKKYDNLTAIYNEDSFYKSTHTMLMNNPDTDYIFININIERFKIINDLFGSDEGDDLLKYIAAQLIDIMQKLKGTYGRLMADIFVVCLPKNDIAIEERIQTFQNRIKEYPLAFEVNLSFGIFMIEDHNTPVNLMCDRANLASRTIKGNYLLHYAIYDESMRNNIINEQLIINEMESALANGEFVVYFQPKFSLSSNNILGAEALVRWAHPKKGLIPPNDFIPLFEKNGFITQLDNYVWEQTCIALKRWEKEGREVVPVSVNVSRIHLYNPKLAASIIALVEKHDINPRLLELEITESTYTETLPFLLKTMAELQEYGFIFLMDDFGSGYSSLNMLKDVPVDILKIDINFLAGEDELGRGGSILTSIVRMAKWLKIDVIAEGVETREQADFLKSIGCSKMQGYYFAKPMPLAEYEKLLTKDKIHKEINTHSPSYIGEFDHIWSTSAKNNAIFNSVIGGVGIYDLEDGVLELIRVNDGYYDILCSNPKDLTLPNSSIIEQIYTEDRGLIISSFTEAYNTKKVIESQVRHYLPDGSIIWLHIKIRYLTGDKDKSTFYVAFDDITDIRKQDLKQYFKQYGSLLETIFSEVFKINVTEGTYKILRKSNEIFKQLHDSGNIDECHDLILNRIHQDNKADYLKRFNTQYIKDYFSMGHQQLTGEYKIKVKDNNYCWLTLTIIPYMENADNNIFLCYFSNLLVPQA